MTRIDYYFSLISPFTYLAGLRLEEIAARHGAEIAYHPLDIMALFAETGGQPVGKRHPSRQEYRIQELRRGSEEAGLPFNLKPAHWPTDALPASCAVIACQRAGGPTGKLAHAFLRACWAEEKDIAQPEAVAETLAGQGLGALDTAGAEAEFRANLDKALGAGVFGSPFYIVGGERFWGHDRLDALDRHLGKL